MEFAAIGMRAYLIGHPDKLVGGLTHRRNDRHDTMTTAMQIGETARDRADFCRGFKTGAAVFLHDDGIVAHSSYRNRFSTNARTSRRFNWRLMTPCQRRQLRHGTDVPVEQPSTASGADLLPVRSEER